MSLQIQNELIDIVGGKVRAEIIARVKQSKYFALILDSTPDVTRMEQMSVVLINNFNNFILLTSTPKSRQYNYFTVLGVDS